MSALTQKKERFEALDILRGLAMVIMALDHARDFFALDFVLSSPTDLAMTNMEVFLTRWITHFAAPTFIFLAGIGLFFASGRRTKSQLATLALTRGIWLIFLELTLVGFFWCFSSDFIYKPKVGVLFAIGIAMIAMSVIIYLPRYLIAFISLFLIFGHNMFDSIEPHMFKDYFWIWHLLHVPGNIYIGDIELRVIYPLAPWIGVMALGYLFGPVTKLPRADRKKVFLFTGLSFFVISIMLRWGNIYGDPSFWSPHPTLEYSIMSFLNFTKYPPSLIYILFLLGSAMMLMGLLDRPLGRWSEPLKVFGQVPFFFYILHIPLLHLGGIALALYVFNDASWLFQAPLGETPSGYSYGYELLPTYLAWISAVVILYYPSRWFAGLKASRKDWWISYF
ncbi:DUF1624 domain-containing protein [Sulfurimonas paralvinellae]|uniref:DUF1624 domain-containing protein n=1 Tax=Sulfurimonas paralvinellae TaxID=317658 RepID=A0A7M1B8L1_9BACT|nr:heparan-alpha-glucosaminide N-acetyltransferase domain-containing protein [Sulfurimonas paralvinellae]QOP46069.1 DUF1624 domain-containing protein [Sulfurimonas paralvinellae]